MTVKFSIPSKSFQIPFLYNHWQRGSKTVTASHFTGLSKCAGLKAGDFLCLKQFADDYKIITLNDSSSFQKYVPMEGDQLVAQRNGTGPIGVLGYRIFGLPVDREVLFSDHKKVYKKKIENRQRKLIIKLPFLKPFVNVTEKILLITTGYSPTTTIDRMLIGWLFVYLKRSLFVFTDQRVFHVPTTPVYAYRGSVAQIPYSACKSIAMKGRTLVVEYKKFAKIEKFFGIAGKERKKIIHLLKTLPIGKAEAEVADRTFLCPRCAAPLTENKYTCEKCNLKFKSKALAVLSAVIFPGGGYIYTRQYFLGLMAAVLEIFLIAITGISLMDTLNGLPNSMIRLLFAGFALILEKVIAAVHISTVVGEFIPSKKKFKK